MTTENDNALDAANNAALSGTLDRLTKDAQNWKHYLRFPETHPKKNSLAIIRTSDGFNNFDLRLASFEQIKSIDQEAVGIIYGWVNPRDGERIKGVYGYRVLADSWLK